MSEIVSSLSPEEARAIAAQFVETTDFEVIDLQETTVDNERGGFTSDYLRFQIRLRLPDGMEKSCKCFAKTIPRMSPQFKELDFMSSIYLKEIGFYSKIIPLLLKHQTTKKPGERGVHGRWAPHCFLSRDDLIVMEDLGAAGFTLPKNRDPLGRNHCATVLKKLANFHAASIIFEEKEKQITRQSCRIVDLHPEYFKTILGTSEANDRSMGWIQSGMRSVEALIPYLSKYKHSTELQHTILEAIPGAFQSIDGLETSEQFRNVVCHGDLWSNNMLFRRGEDGQSETVRFVDYQILRYAPPATDIVVFIYTTMDRQFREEHKHELLKEYYEEFASELQNQGLCPNDILSFEELCESVECFSPGGRAISLVYYPFTLMDSEKVDSLFASSDLYENFMISDRSEFVIECFQKDETFRYRMEETLNELIEKDILKEN